MFHNITDKMGGKYWRLEDLKEYWKQKNNTFVLHYVTLHWQEKQRKEVGVLFADGGVNFSASVWSLRRKCFLLSQILSSIHGLEFFSWMISYVCTGMWIYRIIPLVCNSFKSYRSL